MKTLIIAIIIFANIAALQNISAGNKSNQSFQDVITQYLNIKNALADDNSSNAASAAGNLLTALKNVETDKFSNEESKAWKKYLSKLENHAEHISQSTDIEHQRKHFAGLSSDLYSTLKKIKENSVELYYQYCPMAEDGSGAYWLSEKSEIVNPYMGQKMSSCGSTKNTLKAK